MTAISTAGFLLSPQQTSILSSAEFGRSQIAVLVEGTFDESRLRSALEQVVTENESLRTVFHRQAGTNLLLQVVLERGDIAWVWKTVENFDGNTDLAARELMKREASDAMSTEAPQLRSTFFKLSEVQTLWILTAHSAMADTSSMNRIVEKTFAEYSGNCGDAASEFIPYIQFGQWQNDLLLGSDKATKDATKFWERSATDAITPTIPGENTIVTGGESSELAIEIRGDLISVVHSIGGDCIASDLLLAAWGVVIARWSGQQRIELGVLFDGREDEQLASLIGAVAKMLPVSLSIHGQPTFREMVLQTHTRCEEVADVQDYYIPGKSFKVGFEYQTLAPTVVAGARFSPVRVHNSAFNCVLKLNVVEIAGHPRATLQYRLDSINKSIAAEIVASFESFLSEALVKANESVSRLTIVSAARRQQLLSEWNQTTADFGPFEPVSAAFLTHAHKQPDKVALECGGTSWTNEQLATYAKTLVQRLIHAGLSPGELVGICVPRSVEMVGALLAVMMAGGVYVPLDPRHPRERLQMVLSDAGISILLTMGELELETPAKILNLQHKFELVDPHWNAVATTADSLVYVIYTSGSTGKPKGVAIEHGALMNLLRSMQKEPGLTADDTLVAVTTLAFDIAALELLLPLLTGAKLVVATDEEVLDGRLLLGLLERVRATALQATPSTWRILVDSGWTGPLPSKALCGGEALPRELADKLLDRAEEVWNVYGPTETTIWSSATRVTRGKGSLRIGPPIANTQFYVLDEHRQLLPIGVPGDLYIAGAGLARGYWKRPELTAEKFIANPFGSDRIYSSGDIARWHEDATIELLGRADFQVKIRGFRIELGEIEAALSAQAGVRQCVVVAREKQNRPDDRQLVAYVMLDRQQATTLQELKGALRERLPDYMVPALIVEIPKLPLTANGKVDRKSLPAPEERTVNEYKVPAGLTEELLAQIWSDVLKVERISTDEDFFDLGGHSVLATQVISRIRHVFGVDLPLSSMFEIPTIQRIAERINAARLPEGVEAVPNITPVEREGPLPLSFAQQRLWIIDQLEPGNNLYNIPRALRMRGPLNVEVLTQSLNEIIRRHESLRTWFASDDSEPVQHIEPALQLHVEYRDLTPLVATEREDEASRLVADETSTPFDLSIAPLLRAVLVKMDTDDHVFILTMHHIVSDAWSAAIFMQELQTIYAALLRGALPELPELTVQYADYASWQRRRLQGKVLDNELSFWRNELAEVPPLLTLPADHPRPERPSFAGDTLKFHLPVEVFVAIKALCKREGVTLFMALLAGYYALLSRLSRQQQIVVGTDSANRFNMETERMIGFFINLLPLKIDLEGNPTFREMLQRVRETTLACYAHQEMPFDKIVEDLRPDRKPSHHPIVQVLFVMQNVPLAGKQLGGLDITGFRVPRTRSKFDIAVFAIERADTVECIWVYSTELFKPSTINRMGHMYSTLLANAVAVPETRLSAIELYSEEQKKRLIDDRLKYRQSSKKKLINAELREVRLENGVEK